MLMHRLAGIVAARGGGSLMWLKPPDGRDGLATVAALLRPAVAVFSRALSARLPLWPGRNARPLCSCCGQSARSADCQLAGDGESLPPPVQILTPQGAEPVTVPVGTPGTPGQVGPPSDVLRPLSLVCRFCQAHPGVTLPGLHRCGGIPRPSLHQGQKVRMACCSA